MNSSEFIDYCINYIRRYYSNELKLTKEISETENRLNKLKKILYRLKVCETILNNEEV